LIQELYNKRKKLIDEMKENNYNASEIIANLYSEISHFIYELLQNAEDSEASFIKFDLQENSLSIIHNGKLFNYADVDAITTIGFSTKKDDLNKIGKFGAGFKSVFSITSTPQIYSGDLSFEITDYIVPTVIEKIELDTKHTKIVLPFNSNKIDKAKAYKIIGEKLERLESESLLFLKNIYSISWSFEEKNGTYTKQINSSKNCKYIDITTQVNNNSLIQSYIKIDKDVMLDGKNLTLSVAYAMKDKKIVPIENAMLSVFFPTKVAVYYKFLLQAPYKTTPNRENIPFDDEDNQFITKQLAQLVGESFLILKDENLLTIEFLESMSLAIRHHQSQLYMAIYEEIKLTFQTNELLPTICDNFAKSTEIALVSNKDLIEFIHGEDIIILTDKKYLFCKPYGSDFTRFLTAILGVREFGNDDILNKINLDFISNKDDVWLTAFYNLLTKQTFNKYYLALKPIMKLTDNSFIPLYKTSSDEKPQVYLPTEQHTRFQTLNKLFVETTELKSFIDKYTISKPNNIAELKEFILPKYQSTPKVEKEEYLEDFNRIIEIYNSANNTDKSQIINLCKNKFIILSCNAKYYQGEYVYLQTDELKKWFKKTPDANFIDTSIQTSLSKAFLDDLGINSNPRFLSGTSYIDGLKNNLENISFEDSLMIWEYLVHYLTLNYIQKDDKTLRYASHTMGYLKSVLNNAQWLKSKYNNDFMKPSEIIFQDLDLRYEYQDVIKQYLLIDIKFKPDRIKQIEEEFNCVLVEKSEFDEFKKWKEAKEIKSQIPDAPQNDTIWKPDTTPNQIKDIQVKSYTSSYNRPNLSYQSGNYKSSTTFEYDNYDNLKSRQAIGDWGENFVNNYLVQKYQNDTDIKIKWLNKDNYLGVGYDFVILKDEKEIEYIEVKSKLSHNPSIIEVSGTQWEWARELYNKHEGDKYKIYIVLGAGSDSASIEIITNPIGQWKEGSLKVHPVNIEFFQKDIDRTMIH